MVEDNRVPTSIVERIMDSADKATAKELSNLESAVAQLVMNLNTPPRIEDVNRLVEGLKDVVENEVEVKLSSIETKVGTLTTNSLVITEKVDTFLSRIKWVAGVIVVTISIAVAVISYVTSITEKSMSANTAVQIKAIEEKYETEKQQREEEFKKLLEEIRKMK